MGVKRHNREDTGVGEVVQKSRHELFLEQLRIKFMKLPKDQKDLIREAKDAGLEWKGEDTHTKLPQLDDLTHFEHVFREWKLMKEIGVEAYRRKALAKLYSYTGGSMGETNR